MLSQNIVKSFSLFIIKSSPGVGGLDADKGAGDNLDVAKKRRYPNNDNLMKLMVKMVSMMMDVVMVARKSMMMLTRMK